MNNCETYRELLVELLYDEIAPQDLPRLEAHLADCASCAARREAFGAVRSELGEWEVSAPRPARVTFVAPPASRTSGPWTRRLAMAASFLVGFLLIAAVANLEVRGGADGWTVRTSLLPRAAGVVDESAAEPVGADGGPSRPGPVERLDAQQPRFGVPVGQGAAGNGGTYRFMSQDDLDSWLDSKLQDRGFARTARTEQLRPEQVQPLLDELMRERDQQIRTLVQDALARSETLTRNEFDAALTGLYQAFEAQRTNDLLFFAGELGLLQEATGQELQRTNAAIDFLIGLEAIEGSEQPQPSRPRDQPEPRR